jgi:hypothetical protein
LINFSINCGRTNYRARGVSVISPNLQLSPY